MSGFDRVGGPSSVVSFSGLINSVHYNDPASVSNNNLAVPMTPLAASNDFLPNMPASNIPTIMPATPMSTAVSVDVPSPTLQNIVSTVNLGSIIFSFLFYLILLRCSIRFETNSFASSKC